MKSWLSIGELRGKSNAAQERNPSERVLEVYLEILILSIGSILAFVGKTTVVAGFNTGYAKLLDAIDLFLYFLFVQK